jgi:hypothetical protein
MANNLPIFWEMDYPVMGEKVLRIRTLSRQISNTNGHISGGICKK